jgi:AAA+ superfamily predicted ATPase
MSESKEVQTQDQMLNKKEYVQWSNFGDIYIPTRKTVEEIPAGCYDIEMSNSHGIFLKRKEIIKDELLMLPNIVFKNVLKDIKTFWDREEFFKDVDYVYKRGIMLYGNPGMGKTCLLQLVADQLITKRNGVVIYVDNPNLYISMSSMLRQIEPDRPIIVIMEDIDEMVRDYNTGTVLNMMDGNNQINKVIYIATTNYPERLEERIINRPSRFDRRYLIDVPDSEVRKFYLQSKIPSKHINEIDIDKWVNDTEGFSLAHIKEMIISIILLGNDYNTTLQELGGMKKKITSNGDTKSVGFQR